VDSLPAAALSGAQVDGPVEEARDRVQRAMQAALDEMAS
jgi:hypothetical protein